MVTASTSGSTSTSATSSNVPILSGCLDKIGTVTGEAQSSSDSIAGFIKVETLKTDDDDFRDDEIITEYECDLCLERFPHLFVWKDHARHAHVPIDMRDKTKYDFFTVHQRLR